MAKIGRPKKNKAIEGVYHTNLKVADRNYQSVGTSVLQTLEELKPENIKSKCVLTVVKEGREYSKLMRPFEVKRMIANALFRVILDKNISLVLA